MTPVCICEMIQWLRIHVPILANTERRPLHSLTILIIQSDLIIIKKKFPSNWKQNIITWTKCSYQIKDQYFNTQLWQLFIIQSVQSWLPQCFRTFPFVPFGKLSSYDFHEKRKQILMRMLVYFILTFIFKLKFTK